MIFFKKNLDLKLLALVSAIVLWIFVVGAQNNVVNLPGDIEVQSQNLAPNLSLLTPLSKVKVKVMTNQENANTVNASEINAFVDLKGLNVGNHFVKVQAESKNPSQTVVYIEPNYINANLEAITSKDVQVTYDLSGKPDDGYKIKDIKLGTNKVTITGPDSAIKKLNKLTVKIELAGNENADFTRLLVPELDDKTSASSLKFDPEQVQAKVSLEKLPADNATDLNNSTSTPTPTPDAALHSKSIMAEIELPDKLENLGIKELKPKSILITVEGTDEELAKLDTNPIRLKFDPKRIDKNGLFVIQESDFIMPKDVKVKLVEFGPNKIIVSS